MAKEIKIIGISPFRQDVEHILQLSNEYAGSLYPAESNHLDGPEVLAKPNVFLVGAFEEDILTGMGAVKILTNDQHYGEIKRMFVLDSFRGKGISKLILSTLESHLLENNVFISRLETGISQPEAIGLYKSFGYQERSPFGDYKPDPLSIFMEKTLPQK